MDTTQDILLSKWPQLKGEVQKRWGKLTDDDLAQTTGKIEELTRILRKRYGYGQAQAEIVIKDWLHDLERAR